LTHQDSFAALSVVRFLRRMADGGHTLLASIHQPRAAIWRLFDKVRGWRWWGWVHFIIGEGCFVYPVMTTHNAFNASPPLLLRCSSPQPPNALPHCPLHPPKIP